MPSETEGKIVRQGLVFIVAVFAGLCPAKAQETLSPPLGWSARQAAGDILIFTPPNLAPGETYTVTVYPDRNLHGRTLEAALTDAANADPLPPGTPSGPIKVNALRANSAGGVRLFAAPNGQTLAGVYTLISADGKRIRLTRVVFSAQGRLFTRYQKQTFAINSAVAEGLKHTGQPAAQERPGAVTAAHHPPSSGKRPPIWIVAPGRGLKAGQVTAIVHHYDVDVEAAGFGGLNTTVIDETFLLLTDGTAHRGLPAAPDQIDAASSRRTEPQAWGRWKRAGNKYLISWNGGPLRPLPGERSLPAAPGTRLAGRWGTGSSSASIAGSSYRLWGVTFTQNGRFVKDGRGGSGNSLFMQSGGQPAIGSEYDDNGSSTTVLGGGTTVHARHDGAPESHRSGTYSLSGYTLTLHYDDGRTERLPFFFGDAAHKTLWFEGAQLARSEDKG